MADLPVGETLELDVGRPAAGGAFVARHEGRTVFVRHALPGERVRAVVTDDRGRYAFADAVEVLTTSPDRVPPPCPYAGPGLCGGCDLQHASPPAQRALKAQVVRDQFRRIAHLDVAPLLDGSVEELPGGLLGWRTRIQYAIDRTGRPGLRKHGRHDVVAIDRCLLGAPGVGDSAVLRERWPGLTGVEVVGGEPGVTVLTRRAGRGRQARGRRPPDRVELHSGPRVQHHTVGGTEFDVAAGGFWQVHPDAAATFAAALLAALEPRPGETVLDLYAGAGALTAVLADAVGPAGRVLGLESDATAVADAERNLADRPWASVQRARIRPDVLAGLDGAADLVVLDPPRAGAGPETMRALLALGPRAVGYLSCDPATLARDIATAVEAGWRLAALRAFDAFPMTQHVECVARLLPAA